MASKEEQELRVQEILNTLDLDELNGSPVNSSYNLVESAKTIIFPEVRIENADETNDQNEEEKKENLNYNLFKFRLLDWNCEDMNEEFILEIFCNANNNFLPDVFAFQNIKLKDSISKMLEQFNFDQVHNDLFKNHCVESLFCNRRVFSRFEAITRENIFLKINSPAEFNKMEARFSSMASLKNRYQRFENFWRIYVTKFMENMVLVKVQLEETKCRKLVDEGNIEFLIVSFLNILKKKSGLIDLAMEEFFVLSICFLCDLAEILEASLVLGCCANFNALNDICASWYPQGFTVVSKGKDKERKTPVDYLAYYQPKSLPYEMQIIKMCRFGHRDRFVPLYRNPHPIQLCDVAIRTRINEKKDSDL